MKKNLRVLRTGGVDAPVRVEYRSVDGGILAQTADAVTETPDEFTVPTKRKPTDEEMDELLFAWKVCKGVKSNAILISKNHAGIGMGPGQPNRVDSGRLAGERALEACERMGLEPKNLVAASDAFFPFRDNIDALASFGVTAIIQPGGSIRDEESIEACDEHGIAMVFTGIATSVTGWLAPFGRTAPTADCAGFWRASCHSTLAHGRKANALWASRQSAPPEPMLADVACGSDFCFAAAIRVRLSIVARVALLRVASLSSQFDSPACRSLTWAAKVTFVEHCSIAISVKRILYGPGNLPGPFCFPGRQLRLLKDASKPVAQPCGPVFCYHGAVFWEKI